MGLFDIFKKGQGHSSGGTISIDSYQFSDPGYKPFGGILVTSINRMSALPRPYELSYNQLKIILKPGNLQAVTESMLYSWKQSVDQDEHVICGMNQIHDVLLAISCFPTGDMSEAKSRYLGIRYRASAYSI